MDASAADPRPLALLEVLDRAFETVGQALGFEGRCRYEVVVEHGPRVLHARVVELWPHREPGKLTRSDLDKLVIPVGVADTANT